MPRDLNALNSECFDLVVIGGGITGICVARDAILRGLTVALIEQNDFASATTSASSKMIHGGLRYLKNFEFSLVRESLRERRLWAKNAPHMMRPLKFMLPTWRSGAQTRTAMHVFISMYDVLSFDRNRLDDPCLHLPRHQMLKRADAVALEPGMDALKATGAAIFYDYQMHSPERLALDCILAAREQGLVAMNYGRVTGFESEEDTLAAVQVEDLLTQTQYTVRGKCFVNASGPWADVLMGTLQEGGSPRKLIRSKGIHLIVRKLTEGHAIGLNGHEGHFFLIPWRGHTIIGTTDTVYKGDPGKVYATEKDIQSMLKQVNEFYPSVKLKRADVLHTYAGLRPIVDRETKVKVESNEDESYGASRKAEVVDHARHGGPEGVLTAIGGKWTTSRSLAEEVVDRVFEKLDRKYREPLTDVTPVMGGDISDFDAFLKKCYRRYNDYDEEQLDYLAEQYGTCLHKVLALTAEDPEWAEAICADRFEIGAQVIYAVRKELACALEDVIFRRTGLGTLGHPGDAALQKVARWMEKELGWTHVETQSQLDQVEAVFIKSGYKKADQD